MRQSAAAPTSLSPNTANSEALHPVLRTALANLDVQLEEELARYRRQRAGGSSVARHANRKRTAKPPNLIAIAATDAKVINFDSVNAESVKAESQMDVTNRDAQNRAAIAANLALANPSTASNLSSNLGDTADLQQPDAQLDDYLESSEELLRSLAEEEAKVQAERGFMRNLLTPLGIGSMLLLVLSSAMFGYLVMNPASLSQIFTNRDANSSSDAPPQVPPTAVAPDSTTPQPNLANREFKDLNLNTLGTLKPNAAKPSVVSAKPSTKAVVGSDRPVTSTSQPTSDSPTATAAASSSAEPGLAPATPTRPVAPEPEAPRSVPENPAPLPATRNPEPPVVSAPAPPAPVSTSRSEELPYKVVTPYTGDSALEEAKRTAPDAFVRNDDNGANIQVGAYSSSADADSQVRELRQRGISAEVQKR